MPNRAVATGDRRDAGAQGSGQGPRTRYAGAVKAHRRTWKGTSLELFFTLKPLPEHQPLIVFHHIRKTGGTSLKTVLSRNVPGSRHLSRHLGSRRLYLDVPAEDSPKEPLAEWYRAFYDALHPVERASLSAAASHSANYLIPLVDRRVRALTLVRDPIDRALSRHYFFGKKRTGSLAQYYADASEDDTGHPEFYNGQSRSLLEPHYDMTQLSQSFGPPPDADLWRTRLFSLLSEYYLVGVQDRFEESVRRFGHELGWKRVVIPQAKVNKSRPRDVELDEDTYERIRAANWLDFELYEHALVTLTLSLDKEAAPKPGRAKVRRAKARRAKTQSSAERRSGYHVEPGSARDTIRSVRDTVERAASAAHAERVATHARFAVLEEHVRRIERIVAELVPGAQFGRGRDAPRAPGWARAEAAGKPTGAASEAEKPEDNGNTAGQSSSSDGSTRAQ